MEHGVPELAYQKYTLPNGLTVILREDHRLPLVAVNLWYHVGPADERPGLTGFAHLFEHMMFEGSKHVGEGAHFRYLEAAGASEINGTTDFDRTNYFETLPSNQLELALWLESDRMGFLLEKLDSGMLENQRDVVRNERRQSVESMPYGLVQEAVFHLLFPKEHPYYASVIGSHADIEAARLADVREFFRAYYAPNNASLAVVGDIAVEETRQLIDRYFGPIPPGPPICRNEVITPSITSERRIVVEDQVALPRIYLAWITPAIFKAGDAECDLLAKILGGGKSSRLYRRLVYESRLAQDASANQSSLALGSVFTIDVLAKPAVEPSSLEAAIDEEIERFLDQGPTEEEVEAARNTYEAAIIRGLENLGGFGGVADRLNLYQHFLGDPGRLPEDLARYRGASAEALRETARQYLRRQTRAVVYGVPGQKTVDDPPRKPAGVEEEEAAVAAAVVPGQEWRSRPPAPGPFLKPSLPVPQVFKLGSALTVYLVEMHSLPVVTVNLAVIGGSDRNPPGRPGLASFAAEMLDEGTDSRSALKIAEDADRLGTHISTGSSMDACYVSFRTLRRNVEAALDLATDVLLHPAFPEEEIERIRHDRLTEIRRQKQNPNVLAGRAFARAVYGARHPYGYSEIGTEESLQALTRDEIRQFWQKGYRPGAAVLIAAGDITAEELLALAQKHLGAWRGNGDAGAPPEVDNSVDPRIVVVDLTGSPQTVLRIGHVGVPRRDPDCVALEVMNAALGGLFSSRINMNLREKNGYTYGASSGFSFRRGAGPFVVSTGVRTDATAAAIREVFHELERMRQAEAEPAELALARDSIARSLPGWFETTAQTASSLGQLFLHDLPPDYYRTLPGRIAEVSGADVQHVARAHLRPEEMVVVAVGDRQAIEPGLRELGIRRVEICSAEEIATR